MPLNDYEMVIGLEVHCELDTSRKIFCFCERREEARPNEQTCPVCLAMPGTLPVLNRDVVKAAVKAGLALGGEIARVSHMDRKNYFYPDLPKAYQITQNERPLVKGGQVAIETRAGKKTIRLTRIHMEEDAGKLIHLEGRTLIDCNRCGVPLIEIVSEPELSSAEEVVQYLRKLRAILVYSGVSKARMEQGEFRCDVNLSVRKKGDSTLGTRTEMKNLNSFNFVARAIDLEFRRQVECLENGGDIQQETRRFDEKTNQTYAMRTKEDAEDYRYFADPDLVAIHLSDAEIALWQKEIPSLPDARKARYIEDFDLTAYDAERLTEEREQADYFEEAAALTAHTKTLANLLITEMPALLGERPLPAADRLAQVASLQGEGRINSSTSKKVLIALIEEGIDPETYVQERKLLQIEDEALLRSVVLAVIAENAKIAADFRGGKAKALQALIGKVMQKTGGRAQPVLLRKLLEEELAQEP